MLTRTWLALFAAVVSLGFTCAAEPIAMIEAERINLERNLRWMLERERAAAKAKPAVAKVVVFADAGVWHPGAKSIVELLEAEGIACRVLDHTVIADGLKEFETLILPGGWAPLQVEGLGEKGLDAIKAFAKTGGRCVGICAGAYLLSKTVKYDDKEYPYPLGLFDGSAVGPVPKLAAFPKPGSAKLTPTEAGKKRGLAELGKHEVFYSGGPCFEDGTGVTVLAEYHNGSAAIIERKAGKGSIALIGGHLERPVASKDDDPAPKFAGPLLKALITNGTN